MGRWRPPRKPGSPYVTPAGFAALEREQKALWAHRRDVVKALAAAAAEGDRSENAEYIYRKKELAGIDRRIRYLQKRLPVLNVVRHRVAPEGVYFGARVDVRFDDGEARSFRIVGEDEADPGKGDVNIDSPLAQALLKRLPGDRVEIGGEGRHGLIEDVRYDLEDCPGSSA